MDFDDQVGRLNRSFFFGEFTFTKCLRRVPQGEDEIADGLIVLGDITIAIQNKERTGTGPRDDKTESRWFEQKLKMVSKQMRATHGFIQRQEPIQAFNLVGDQVSLVISANAKVHYVALFSSDSKLPRDRKLKKYHLSRTTGIFIHIFQALDYQDVLKTLVTPPEIDEYLHFREQLVSRWPEETQYLSETALLGQFVSTRWSWVPEQGFEQSYRALRTDDRDWGFAGFIQAFRRHSPNRDSVDYYPIIRELALLKRTQLREFVRRFLLLFEASKKGEFKGPFRIVANTGCGFVFMSCPPHMSEHQGTGLLNFTYGHKYDQRLERCIGVSFLPLGNQEHSVGWCYITGAWEYDARSEEFLAEENTPFLPLRHERKATYDFS